MYDEKPQVRELIDTARALEGMPRHASTHAAGVVITKDPVDTYVPLARNDEQMVTQFTMTTLEELGPFENGFSRPAQPDGHRGRGKDDPPP